MWNNLNWTSNEQSEHVPRGTNKADRFLNSPAYERPALLLRFSAFRTYSCSYQEKSPQRMRNLDRFLPVPCIDLLNFWQVSRPNPQNNLFRCYVFRMCPSKKGRELTERSRADVVERSELFPQLFIAPSEHLRVPKSQFTNNFREKCDLLDVGFNQINSQPRPHDLEG